MEIAGAADSRRRRPHGRFPSDRRSRTTAARERREGRNARAARRRARFVVVAKLADVGRGDGGFLRTRAASPRRAQLNAPQALAFLIQATRTAWRCWGRRWRIPSQNTFTL